MSDTNPSGEINSVEYPSNEFNSSSQNGDDNGLSRLAISQIYSHRCSLETELQALKQSNISAIGLYRPRFAEWSDQQDIELLQQHRVQVSSVSWAGGFTGSHGYSHDEAVADSFAAIELAEKVGAGCVMIATGARHGHTRNHTTRLICDGLKEVSDFAGERKIDLAVVPMRSDDCSRWTCLNTIDEAMQVILKCNRPNVGLGIDVRRLSEACQLAVYAESIAPHTKMMRLAVECAEVTSELIPTCSYEEETFSLEETLTLFSREGYEGYFEFELCFQGGWSAKRYREMVPGCRELFVQSVLI